MKYTFNSRVRYSETDIHHRLRPDAVLDYFQDCSTFQSESIGEGMDGLREKGMVWVVNFWQIVFDRPLKLMDAITVGTAPVSFKRCIGQRNFWIDDESGQKAVRCNSIWTLITLDGLPGKVSEEMLAHYGEDEPLEMDYANRKIPLPKEPEAEGYTLTLPEEIPVREYFLDANLHVNNGWYIKLALALAGAGNAELRELRAEYKKSALPNEIMYPRVYTRPEDTIVSFCTTDGSVYATVQLFR